MQKKCYENWFGNTLIAKCVALSALLLLIFSLRVNAAEAYSGGYYNSGDYGMLQTSVINGKSWRYTINGSECIIWGCAEKDGTLDFPESIDGYNVTAIGSGAFENQKDLSGSLTIPPYVKTIGDRAFYMCEGLNGKLTLPSRLSIIGDKAFYGCKFDKVGNASDCNIPTSELLRTIKYYGDTPADMLDNDHCYINDETSEEVNQIGTGLYTRKSRDEGAPKFDLTVSETQKTARVGDVIELVYKFRANKSPRLYIDVENASGDVINNIYMDFYNAPEDFTITYNSKYPTSGLSAGEYKVVAYMGYKENASGDYVISSEGKTITTLVLTAEENNVNEEQVRAFVTRLYEKCLARLPEEDGLNYWANSLMSGDKKAVDVVQGVLCSPEYGSKGKANGEVVNDCYQAMLGRSADEGGYADWTSRLDAGMSVNAIFAGFVGSEEFGNLCASYGIAPGTYELTEERDKNAGVTKFVSRLYTQALGRNYDVDGLNDWCGQINANTSRDNILRVATDGFFHSQEFTNKNLNNEDFVKVCYRTYLGREYDDPGLADWLGKLDRGEMTRDQVMEGFAYSIEFGNIMSQYGL